MRYQTLLGAIGLTAMSLSAGEAQIFDPAKYPDMGGQWRESGVNRWAPGEKPPLTAEYQTIFNTNLADQAAGGQGTDPMYRCLPPGMPRVMHAYSPMEIVITPKTTYMLIEHIHDDRRIHTDGRDWPREIEHVYSGYSIGSWRDESGTGRYDVLEVETRFIKGPRSLDGSGLPTHEDNQSIVKERIYLDKASPDILRDEITLIDHAYTRPWTVLKTYPRSKEPTPIWWREAICAENNSHVTVGNEDYFVSADGYLMPVRNGQAPPDLRYFNQSRK
ncbi:MAG TPA: hypothetical protein VH684_22240 [Xanthobacteraceae bacterium]|jgi:hypothetical protein